MAGLRQPACTLMAQVRRLALKAQLKKDGAPA
jgi:hypothetical protein